jgi:hypothetical protein
LISVSCLFLMRRSANSESECAAEELWLYFYIAILTDLAFI